MDLRRRPVISIDLSPAGNILATGSGDWQARICAFVIMSSIYRCSSTCYSRELPNHLALIFGSIGRIAIVHLRVALFSCFPCVVDSVLCSVALVISIRISTCPTCPSEAQDICCFSQMGQRIHDSCTISTRGRCSMEYGSLRPVR